MERPAVPGAGVNLVTQLDPLPAVGRQLHGTPSIAAVPQLARLLMRRGMAECAK
jgi:hypothetical protein